MLKRLRTYEDSPIECMFPSGEHAGERYRLELGFCPNPVCRCGAISVRAEREGLDKADNRALVPAFEFSVDIFEKGLGASPGSMTKYDQNFGDAFVDHLTEQDWGLLTDSLRSFKLTRMNEVRDEELRTQFFADQIEENAAMVGFHDILPYAEENAIEIDNRGFVLDEQYCVKPGCNCSDVAVSLLDVDAINDHAGRVEYPLILLDYRKATWRVERKGGEGNDLLNRIGKQLSRGEHPSCFERHHKRLKALYRLYKERHNVGATPTLASRKIGRNSPCPCGSGKKYKKCCLGASVVPS